MQRTQLLPTMTQKKSNEESRKLNSSRIVSSIKSILLNVTQLQISESPIFPNSFNWANKNDVQSILTCIKSTIFNYSDFNTSIKANATKSSEICSKFLQFILLQQINHFPLSTNNPITRYRSLESPKCN